MTDLNTPITPDPSDPGNWREIDRLRRLAESEGRTFDPSDPYNWQGIAAAGGGGVGTPGPAGTTPGTTTPVAGVTPTAGGGGVGTPGPAGTTPGTTTPVAGVTPTAGVPGTPTDAARRNRDLFASIQQMLNDAGLAGLYEIGADGMPGGRLWEQITSGLDSQAALIIWFEQTQEFQARYPVIGQIRASGMGRIPTVNEVRVYEQTAAQMMRQAGLPAWFYDQPGELQTLMGQDISTSELEERLGAAWSMVRDTDPAVNEAFANFYGVSGDAAMAAFFLDPTRTQAQIDRASRAAYTSGMGSTIGVTIDQVVAERIANLPTTSAGIWQDLTQVAAVSRPGGLLTEGITEVNDITQSDAIDATVFGDGEALADLERRQIRRDANDRSSLGGAAVTQQGAVGVGTAQRR